MVPFFGDQPFWGQACYRAGVGPRPLPIDSLNSRRLIDAIQVGVYRLAALTERVECLCATASCIGWHLRPNWHIGSDTSSMQLTGG